MELEHDSGDDLLLAVAGHHAAPHIRAVLHVRDFPELQRHAVDFADGQVADVVERLEHADAAHQILLGADFDVLAADVAVVRVDRLDHIVVGDVVFAHQLRIQLHLVLQHMAAHRQDRGHARHCLELAFDHEIVEFAQVGVQLLALGVRHLAVGLQIVNENLAEAA